MTNLSQYFPNKYPASVYTPPLGGWTGTSKSTESFVHGTGNKVTWVAQLRIPEFAGTNSAAVFNAGIGSGAAILAFAYPTGFATVGQRKKLIITVRNSGGTDICSLASDIDFTDGELHSVLFAYDGTAGVATFTIDGKDADDLSFATRALITGTIPTTTLTWALAGAWWASSNYVTGEIGFIGMDDSYISDYGLFFDSDNNPIKQDTDDWSQSGWGVQPNVWNEYGYLPDNKGSIGLFSTGPKYFTDEPEITAALVAIAYPEFINSTQVTYANTGSVTVTIPVPSGILNKDLVVITGLSRNSYIGEPEAGGWIEALDLGVLATGVDDPSTGNDVLMVWYKIASGSEPATYDFLINDDGTDGQALHCLVFRNATQIIGYTADDAKIGPSISADKGDILLSLHVAAYSLSSADSVVAPVPMVLIDKQYNATADCGDAVAYEKVWVTGPSGIRTWTSSWTDTTLTANVLIR